MRKRNLFIVKAFALVLIFLLSACAEEPLGGNEQTREGYTVTLRLSASMTPIPETKATARSGNETEVTGFKYERMSSDADRAATTPGIKIDPKPVREDSSDVHFVTKALATKAPSVLKNAYGLLFMSDGRFNGRAPIGAYTVDAAQDITFTNVIDPTASGCRLVIVANNNAATTSYASDGGTGGFANFSGTYAEFQKLTITNEVRKDEDVPYAGNATVNLSLGEIAATAEVTLSWTLAKITLNNHTFNITGGPARSSIILYNAGVRRFAPDTGNDYEGTGSTPTIAFVPNTGSDNSNSVTWYVGENIQSSIADIKTPADRNSSKAPKNACYIRVASATLAIPKNITPKIGEEYMPGGTRSFTYDYYLGKSSEMTDFALRRHTVYQLSTEISGTLAEQEEIAATDGRVIETRPEPAGLAIGYFGGPAGYVRDAAIAIKGSYTKMLLLQPNTNTSSPMATDNIRTKWSDNITTSSQSDGRKYWDPTYTSAHMDQTPGFAYDYCHQLTLGDVPAGTWYLPTQAQFEAVWSVFGGLKAGGYERYVAFATNLYYWCSTDNGAPETWLLNFANGDLSPLIKNGNNSVRCVRDASTTEVSDPYVTEIDGYPVIDVSALSTLGCVLTGAEAAARRTAINEQTPRDNEYLGVGSSVSGHNGTWNAKMSPKFQVMCKNLNSTAVVWVDAYKACRNYSGEGGGAGEWRLPTQRELMILWTLHPQLLNKGGFTAPANPIWACTEGAANHAWSLFFTHGDTTPGSSVKTVMSYVRCVRDRM